MADLQIFPIALPGGINQGNANPVETDLEECKNLVPYRGRLTLRGPINTLVTITDDQGTPASVTAILDIIDHGSVLWVASWSSVTDEVYLHSVTYAGVATLRGVLWSAVTSRPYITLVGFEGGTAEAGTSRVYACDYSRALDTKYWNGTSIVTATSDLDNSGAAENLNFALMFSYKYHLWGTGHYEASVSRPEMIRFSQPGLIPCADPGGGSNPKEWISADHRSVGPRGEKIRAGAQVGDRLILFQREKTHAIFGSGAANWTRQELSPTIGCVGPGAVATADNRVAYFWSPSGPYRTDGSEVQYIGDPIQDLITEVDASELGTRVGYSPYEGLVHYVVSLAGADDYKLSLTFDHRGGRWLKAEWLVGTSTEAEIGTIQAVPQTSDVGGHHLLLGERSGARIFKQQRVGRDADGEDLGSYVYTGTLRSERISPAGPDGLVNFRRVVIKTYSSGTHEYSIKVWVDGVRTVLGDGSTQTVTVVESSAVEGEYSNEIAIQAAGNHIQVELTIDSDDITAPFMIESITAHGRVIRGTSGRVGETS